MTDAKLIGGGVVVAVALSLLFLWPKDDDTTDAACKLSGLGVAAIAAGLSEGRGSAQIIAGSAGILTPLACEKAVDSLAASPEQPVTIGLQGSTGDTREESITGGELVEPAPQAPTQTSGVSVQRLIDCLGWRTNFLYRACAEGVIDPPAIAVPAPAPPATSPTPAFQP